MTEFTGVQTLGPIENTVIIIYEKLVPDISVRRNPNSNIVTFILDINSHAIDVPENLADSFALFVADAMAHGAGYSCFGTDHKFNKFNRSVHSMNGMDMDNLEQESEAK